MNHLNLVRTCELTEKEGEPRVVVEKHAGWGRNGSAGWVAQLGVKEGVLQRAFLNPSRSQLSRAVVRGGKVSLEDRIACFGEAFSLRLRSDPEKDTALFRQMMGGEVNV